MLVNAKIFAVKAKTSFYSYDPLIVQMIIHLYSWRHLRWQLSQWRVFQWQRRGRHGISFYWLQTSPWCPATSVLHDDHGIVALLRRWFFINIFRGVYNLTKNIYWFISTSNFWWGNNLIIHFHMLIKISGQNVWEQHQLGLRTVSTDWPKYRDTFSTSTVLFRTTTWCYRKLHLINTNYFIFSDNVRF